MNKYLVMAAAGVAAYLVFNKLASASGMAQPSSGLIDNKGREIFLQEKNGFLMDQYGGMWT